MAQMTVGVREVKAQLSRYLRLVAAGDTVVITDRGKPVGQIVPVADGLEARLQRLVETGVVAWSGRKPATIVPVTPNPGGPTVSDLLLEDRE
jgi:prevent-host-death family protein